MDIQTIALTDKRETRTLFGNDVVLISTVIKFENMSFVRDFRFEAEEPEKIPDQAKGSVIIKPEEFYFSVQVSTINRAASCAALLCEQTNSLEIYMNFQ